MAIYDRNLNQVATYWPPATDPVEGGGVEHGAPVAIRCRWQNVSRLFRSVDGQEITSSAIVYPNRELIARGYLFLGTSTATDPRRVDGAREIGAVGKSPSLDAAPRSATSSARSLVTTSS